MFPELSYEFLVGTTSLSGLGCLLGITTNVSKYKKISKNLINNQSVKFHWYEGTVSSDNTYKLTDIDFTKNKIEYRQIPVVYHNWCFNEGVSKTGISYRYQRVGNTKVLVPYTYRYTDWYYTEQGTKFPSSWRFTSPDLPERYLEFNSPPPKLMLTSMKNTITVTQLIELCNSNRLSIFPIELQESANSTNKYNLELNMVSTNMSNTILLNQRQDVLALGNKDRIIEHAISLSGSRPKMKIIGWSIAFATSLAGFLSQI